LKEIVVLSGKGGTGKTTLAGSIASLASNEMQLVIADLDVDASNLELIVQPNTIDNHIFTSGKIAVIENELCTQCGLCLEACRFDAVKTLDGEYLIDESYCEGCLSCYYQCPINAIHTEERVSGEWFHSNTPYGKLFHARLKPGAENSGKLVTQVRSAAAESCNENQCELMLLDGPPGIGCPVTASIRGADYALIVTEPTQSGLHDLERIFQVAEHFSVPAFLVVNKADLNEQIRSQILDFARWRNLPILGEIPYDEHVIVLQSTARPLTEVDESAATDAIRFIWQRLKFEADLSEIEHNQNG
jgi:MinD superfamily P-loop ATPase